MYKIELSDEEMKVLLMDEQSMIQAGKQLGMDNTLPEFTRIEGVRLQIVGKLHKSLSSAH